MSEFVVLLKDGFLTFSGYIIRLQYNKKKLYDNKKQLSCIFFTRTKTNHDVHKNNKSPGGEFMTIKGSEYPPVL